jgi:hypothetical protein
MQTRHWTSVPSRISRLGSRLLKAGIGKVLNTAESLT